MTERTPEKKKHCRILAAVLGHLALLGGCATAPAGRFDPSALASGDGVPGVDHLAQHYRYASGENQRISRLLTGDTVTVRYESTNARNHDNSNYTVICRAGHEETMLSLEGELPTGYRKFALADGRVTIYKPDGSQETKALDPAKIYHSSLDCLVGYMVRTGRTELNYEHVLSSGAAFSSYSMDIRFAERKEIDTEYGRVPAFRVHHQLSGMMGAFYSADYWYSLAAEPLMLSGGHPRLGAFAITRNAAAFDPGRSTAGVGEAGTDPVAGADGKTIPGSIARLERIRLGGVPQWVLIRGAKPDNPVLLFLHGGPGTAEMFMNVRCRELERHFTVVYWDQRGSGKSYRAGAPVELSVGRLVADTIELSDYLGLRFRQSKIFLAGHSWGSLLGAMAVQRHPERFQAFIGIGQAVDMVENERLSWQFAVDEATRRNNQAAAEDLVRIGPPPYAGADWLAKLSKQREWLGKFGGGIMRQDTEYGEYRDNTMMREMAGCKEYTPAEKDTYVDGLVASMERLWPEVMRINLFKDVPELTVPVYFATGRYDQTCPSSLSRRYFEAIKAPRKQWRWFEESAHSPIFEEPAAFTAFMVDTVLAECGAPAVDADDDAPEFAGGIAQAAKLGQEAACAAVPVAARLSYLEDTRNYTPYRFEYELRGDAGGWFIQTTVGGERHLVRNDSNLDTQFWRLSDPAAGTDLSVTRVGNCLVAAGSFKGQPTLGSFPVDDAPWRQSIDFAAPDLLAADGRAETEFWLLKSYDIQPLKMRLAKEAAETLKLGGADVPTVRMKLTVDGVPEQFYHSIYWYRASDGLFVKYQGKRDIEREPTITWLVDERREDQR